MTIAIGTRKGLWLAHQDDDGWRLDGPHFAMQEVTALLWQQDGERIRLLVGTMSPHWGPTVAMTEDLGTTWTDAEGGAMRFGADDGATLERVWQLTADPHRPGTVWAGCEPTSLWRSDDGGVTFTLNRGLWDHPHRPQWFPGFGGAAVHTVVPRSASTVVVAMSTGGVYRSEDDGGTWRPTNRGISAYFMPDPDPEFGQCVHKVAADSAGALYAQNHHGVYRSDDDGLTWTSIADGLPSDFGFVMLAHPSRPGTLWVVPLVADAERIPPGGRLRVWRSNDGGRSWEPSASGLPDDCFTVVLRDSADAVALDGTDRALIVIGTRDGCVYASTDDARTFEQVAAHLPDVLCVRAT